MIWLAFALAVAGIVGLVLVVICAANLKAKLHHFGEEAQLLGDRVTQLQAMVDEIAADHQD